ncbi:hypothetical protein DL98DRAFT_602374 [Cadophora sp. DSE1049]|nr:hypothetical protein DL98DRAFT_602374 [Cadophora sp. DSE1049]
MDINDPQYHPILIDESENTQDEIHESRSSLPDLHQSPHFVANRPPLTSRYLKIFTFQGQFGEVETGLALTKNLIWQLNAVYRSGNKANEYAEAISNVDGKLAEWGSLVSELQELIENTVNDHDHSSILQSLQEAEEMVVLNEQKRLQLVERFQYWTDEKELPLRQMLQNVHVVLESNNLLDEVPGDSEVMFQDSENDQLEESAAVSFPSPSPGEIDQLKLEAERQKAWDDLQDRRLRLQEAQARLENWNGYCEAEYDKFLQLRSEGVIGATKTEFDVKMVRQGQAATRACIKAENELGQAIDYARMLKLNFEEYDQESGFVSQIEDGHIESMDPAKVHTVDQERIERWMSGDNEALEPSGEVDVWVCKPIGIYDSVSIVGSQVATGKQRKRIDRWRSICGLNKRDGNGKTDGNGHSRCTD